MIKEENILGILIIIGLVGFLSYTSIVNYRKDCIVKYEHNKYWLNDYQKRDIPLKDDNFRKSIKVLGITITLSKNKGVETVKINLGA